MNHTEPILALLRQATPVTFRAGGPSMHPSIRDGDSVRVRPFHPRDLRRGALFLYQAHGRLILHRMVRCHRKQGIAWMTGDAALSGVERIPISSLAGTAETVLRHTGREKCLDSRTVRWLGLGRFILRPLRRLLWQCRQGAAGDH